MISIDTVTLLYKLGKGGFYYNTIIIIWYVLYAYIYMGGYLCSLDEFAWRGAAVFVAQIGIEALHNLLELYPLIDIKTFK